MLLHLEGSHCLFASTWEKPACPCTYFSRELHDALGWLGWVWCRQRLGNVLALENKCDCSLPQNHENHPPFLLRAKNFRDQQHNVGLCYAPVMSSNKLLLLCMWNTQSTGDQNVSFPGFLASWFPDFFMCLALLFWCHAFGVRGVKRVRGKLRQSSVLHPSGIRYPRTPATHVTCPSLYVL